MAHPVCPGCGRHLSASFQNCPYCGAELEQAKEPEKPKIICRKCGSELSADDLYCLICGTPVKEEKPEAKKKPQYTPNLTLDSNPFVSLAVEAESLDVKRVCPKCGRGAENDAAFCIYCGERLI